jgi:hypothetical protein
MQAIVQQEKTLNCSYLLLLNSVFKKSVTSCIVFINSCGSAAQWLLDGCQVTKQLWTINAAYCRPNIGTHTGY